MPACAKLFRRICGKVCLLACIYTKNMQQYKLYAMGMNTIYTQISCKTVHERRILRTNVSDEIMYKYAICIQKALWKTRWKVCKSTRYSVENYVFHNLSASCGRMKCAGHAWEPTRRPRKKESRQKAASERAGNQLGCPSAGGADLRIKLAAKTRTEKNSRAPAIR